MQAPIPDNAILSDVYNEYSAGILDQSVPLPDRYNTAFIVASIERSPQSGAWKSRKLKTETDTETDGGKGNIQAIIT